MIAVIKIVRIGQRQITHHAGRTWVVNPNLHQLLWCFHTGRRAEQQSVNKAEYCCIQPNAQSQCDDDGNRRSWIFAKHAGGEAQVLPQRVDKKFPAPGANDFLGNFWVSALQAHSAKRILTTHALFHLFSCFHLQVGA